MLIIVKFLAKLISILNSEISPRQIAAGFAFGVMVGLVPIAGLLPYLLTLLSLVINVNLAALAFAAFLFKIISFALDPLANQIGYYFLAKTPALKPFWTALFNMPLVPYTRFNNTIVLGSLIIGLLLFIPMYVGARIGVVRYRTRLRDKFMKFKIVQVLKTSSLWQWYERYKGAQGE